MTVSTENIAHGRGGGVWWACCSWVRACSRQRPRRRDERRSGGLLLLRGARGRLVADGLVPTFSQAARVHDRAVWWLCFCLAPESGALFARAGPSPRRLRDASGAREPVPGPRRRRGRAGWLASVRH